MPAVAEENERAGSFCDSTSLTHSGCFVIRVHENLSVWLLLKERSQPGARTKNERHYCVLPVVLHWIPLFPVPVSLTRVRDFCEFTLLAGLLGRGQRRGRTEIMMTYMMNECIHHAVHHVSFPSFQEEPVEIGSIFLLYAKLVPSNKVERTPTVLSGYTARQFNW